MSLIKPWLVLALIFVAGALAGGALTFAYEGRPHFPGEAQMRHHWMEHLARRLDLTSDQQAKIAPILEKAGQDIEKMHHDEMDRGGQIMKAAHEQIEQLLNDQQKAEFQKMEDERKKAFATRMGAMGGPPGPPDEGRPPPPNDPPPGAPPGQPSPPPAPAGESAPPSK
jgi:Spy/CpxP family protein refolding chaperone